MISNSKKILNKNGSNNGRKKYRKSFNLIKIEFQKLFNPYNLNWK